MLTSATTKVAGLEFIATKCPKCGRPMYKRICPCRLRKQGWGVCAQCVKCGALIGIEKRRKR